MENKIKTKKKIEPQHIHQQIEMYLQFKQCWPFKFFKWGVMLCCMEATTFTFLVLIWLQLRRFRLIE